MFDPENVKRYQPWLSTGMSDTVIKADDYDQLLELYRSKLGRIGELEGNRTQLSYIAYPAGPSGE